jgi:predicted methyltransferase
MASASKTKPQLASSKRILHPCCRNLNNKEKEMKNLLLVSLAFAFGCASKPVAVEPTLPVFPSTLEEALNSTYRSAANKERDKYRHPEETLKFFGLTPQMTVIEIAPGAGWYAQILAPYLAPQGQYVAAAVPTSVYAGGQKFLDWVDANPELKAKIKIVDFAPPSMVNLGADNSADMVLTFRNVHNWMSNKGEKAAFKAFFKVLKKGGTLGVVEHRANPKAKKDASAKSGYVPEADVIKMAKAAGFKLVEKSEINANPKDTKDYAKGVWTLPPTFALGEQDKAKYLEIGESDRMTLKFVKP